MEYKKLGDYCNITSSKRIFAEQYVSEGIPFYRSKEIIEKNNNQNISEPLFISKETYETIKEKFGVPKENDILLTSVGTLGIPYIVKNETFYFKDGNLTWLKDFKKELNQKYLYYWLSSKFGYKSLTLKAIGSSQPALTIDILKKYKLFIPPLPTQQKIATILSAYDNLIQNYKKQIETLQTAASELYKEWFVRFRFPGYQTTRFENGIPEGWKVERIGALYDSTSGGTPSREHEEYFQNGTYPWIKTGELKDCPIIETAESITDEAIKHSSAKLFEKDSLIIAMYGATIGQLGINKMKATCNQACCVLRPKKDKVFGIYYLFHFFKENREFIIGLGNGAAQQNLSQVLINKLKIVNPNKEILEIFEKKESMFFEKIYLLQQQITNLTQQRDMLLPRLMSGKQEVK